VLGPFQVEISVILGARCNISTCGETQRAVRELANGDVVLNRCVFTNLVLGVGGVYEVYPSRHTIIRFEAGSATIFYQPKNSLSAGEEIYTPCQVQTSLLLSFGAEFRF
jgi:hypothetical protein